MSMSQLVDGADCGPVNPLNGLMKQFSQDRSLQQDRIASTSRHQPSFRNRGKAPAHHELEFAEEFHRQVTGSQIPHSQEFDAVLNRMDTLRLGAPPLHASPAGDWSQDFLNASPQVGKPDLMVDPSQYEEFNRIFKDASRADGWVGEFTQYNPPPMMNQLDHHDVKAFNEAFEQAEQTANWEKEFAALEGQGSWADEFAAQEKSDIVVGDEKEALRLTAGKLLNSVSNSDNPKFKNSQFMAFMQKLRDNEVEIEGQKVVPGKGKVGEDWAAEFQGTQAHTRGGDWATEFGHQQLDHRSEPIQNNDWATEFQSAVSKDSVHDHDWVTDFARDMGLTDRYEMGKGDELNDWVSQYRQNIEHLRTAQDTEWDSMQKDWEKYSPDKGLGYRADAPEYATYQFTSDNPFLNMTPAQLDKTLQSAQENMHLAESILALEAKLQLDPQDATSWFSLGVKQQENERDGAAIAALRRSLELDSSLNDAWLSLAVSYVNENCRADAYDALHAWIIHHPIYSSLPATKGKQTVSSADRHQHITNFFLEAARSQSADNMDPDVQVGLGVLFNVSEEYDKAIDCFRAALESRPTDYLLWNKLGATLANSRDTQHAIEAYFEALSINPSYIRARYNLAISCINMEQHKEAAEHLLHALSLQGREDQDMSGRKLRDSFGEERVVGVMGGMSDSVWDALRMVMFMMNRSDLANEAEVRNITAFRRDFEF
ncbi:hypothetical protein BZG36_00805 [Bifiguratus adelaidae]|uniref:Uncharacterized protein n=1 Tax=Bifiguratus adelaidae TaxID=1938954 RepID=A0A261Y6R8_9FUNG|nr:hypothetical protein BZG36_00805 [Bifiguratus adelaidae]